jgi:dTDP-4-amino-4,6-dideoxygalactose transaminase
MERLEKSIIIRRENFKCFINGLDKNKYHAEFETTGTSLFAFPIICKSVSPNKVQEALDINCIENRPLIAGNLLRHPMMKKAQTFVSPMAELCPNANFIHMNSFYVGNNETITTEDVKRLINILNNI